MILKHFLLKHLRRPRLTLTGRKIYSYDLIQLVYNIALSSAKSKWEKITRMITFVLKSWIFDEYYEGASEDELSSVLQLFKQYIEENNVHYTIDNFDCDDYACAFKSFFTMKKNKNSVGIAIGALYKGNILLGYHAWNICVTNDFSILYIEPQTFDVFIPPVSSDGFYYDLMAIIW